LESKNSNICFGFGPAKRCSPVEKTGAAADVGFSLAGKVFLFPAKWKTTSSLPGTAISNFSGKKFVLPH
jgi:hypothetical protein